MKLDFLTDTNPGYPDDSILRLSEFTSTEARAFQEKVKSLIENGISFTITDTAVSDRNVGLTFFIGSDLGIVRKSVTTFDCELSVSRYREMVDLIEPFTRGELDDC